MKINITNGHFLRLANEASQLNSGSLLGYFLSSKLKEFYHNNQIRIQTINAKQNEIMKQYFVFENDQIKMNGEGKEAKPVLLLGKTEEDYKAAMKEFMMQENVLMI